MFKCLNIDIQINKIMIMFKSLYYKVNKIKMEIIYIITIKMGIISYIIVYYG